MMKDRIFFVNRFILVFKEVVEERILEVIKDGGIGEMDKGLEREREDFEKKMKDMVEYEEKKELECWLVEIESKLFVI